MLICFSFICTNRVKQHSADILPIAVLQTGPAELAFGPHAEPAATDGLSVQSLLPALVTRAALQGHNAHAHWHTPRGWRISMAIAASALLICTFSLSQILSLLRYATLSKSSSVISSIDLTSNWLFLTLWLLLFLCSDLSTCPVTAQTTSYTGSSACTWNCRCLNSSFKSKTINPVWDWYRCVSWCQIHTLSNVSTSTFLGLLQGRGSAFSSTAKFSGGRALRDGFLRPRPTSDSDLRFRGVALSLFLCGARAGFSRQLVDLSGMVEQWRCLFTNLRGGEPQQVCDGAQICKELGQLKDSSIDKKTDDLWCKQGSFNNARERGGWGSHHGLVFLNVLVSFLKALSRAFLCELLFLVFSFPPRLLPPPSPSASLGRGLSAHFFQLFLLWSLFGGRQLFDRKPEERKSVDRSLIKTTSQLWKLFHQYWIPPPSTTITHTHTWEQLKGSSSSMEEPPHRQSRILCQHRCLCPSPAVGNTHKTMLWFWDSDFLKKKSNVIPAAFHQSSLCHLLPRHHWNLQTLPRCLTGWTAELSLRLWI